MSGIAIGYAAGPRVPAAAVSSGRSASTRTTARRSEGAQPLMLPFAPTLDRTFAASDTLRVYFEVASRDGMAGLDGTLAIVGTDGAPVHASIPFVPGQDGRVDLRVPLEGLAPGAYILRASATVGEHSATREIGFLIR